MNPQRLVKALVHDFLHFVAMVKGWIMSLSLSLDIYAQIGRWSSVHSHRHLYADSIFPEFVAGNSCTYFRGVGGKKR